ncbi:MAG: toxin-antitoxin system HicB family antitoxin [Oxalobacteraceae bacterium]|nr:toxin-antitoxin system HicB family antitoxin [Oxalobacteraceae bacterium]
MFNVRVPPDLHKQLHIRSMLDQCTLNETVVKASQAWVSNKVVQNHQDK